MIPLKDDIPAQRFPVLTVALVVAALVAFVVTRDWALVVAAAFGWLFGQSVEDALGRLAYAALLAAAACAAAVMLGQEWAPAAMAAAIVVAYPFIHPRAHVVVLSLVPGWMTVTRVPALAVLALWLPLQVLAA